MKFDNDTYLMVAIFQAVYQFEDHVETDPLKYVKRHEHRIEITGQVFEYLGLATPDAKSPIGWRPTVFLINIIAERLLAKKPRATASSDDLDFTLDFLCQKIFGDSSEELELSFETLHALGLLREDDDGWRPTRQMKKLVRNASYKHEKDDDK